MILTFPIVIIIIQITICATGCASKTSSSVKPSKLSKQKSKTKFHVRGDTEVSRNGTVANSMAPSASKVSDINNENKQEVVQKEKSTMKPEEKAKQENGKSQQTEKKNEKKPMITVEPSGDLIFKMESESQTRLTFKNISNEKVMFKIKVSENSYSIFPVFGILEMGESSDVVVTHTPSQCKEAKMVVVNSKYVGEVDLAKSFRNAKPTGGPITINLVAN